MNSGQLTLKSGIFLVFLAATVLFMAVFFGIRAGFAGGVGKPDISPDKIPNYSNLVIDKPLPSLTVQTESGEIIGTSDIIGNGRTVIAVVMPGCGACEALLTEWQTKDLTDGETDIRIVLLVGISDDEPDPGALSEYVHDFDYYFCNTGDLDDIWGVRSFPTVCGIGKDGNIRFAASVYSNFMDGEYFARHL